MHRQSLGMGYEKPIGPKDEETTGMMSDGFVNEWWAMMVTSSAITTMRIEARPIHLVNSPLILGRTMVDGDKREFEFDLSRRARVDLA